MMFIYSNEKLIEYCYGCMHFRIKCCGEYNSVGSPVYLGYAALKIANTIWIIICLKTLCHFIYSSRKNVLGVIVKL